MKRTNRPSSTGSSAGVFTSSSTPASKPMSIRTASSYEIKTVGQQTTVYLNSLELQAALTQQQTQIAKTELAQLQSRLKLLSSSLSSMKHQHALHEALMIKQESELASLKLTSAFLSTQSLPKRLDEGKKALDDLISEFTCVVAARNANIPDKRKAWAMEAGEDRVAGLIVGQIDMYEKRLEQTEQEIRIFGNRFQRELGFAREEQELIRKQTRDEVEMRKIELRKSLKLLRKERLLTPVGAKPAPITSPKKRSLKAST